MGKLPEGNKLLMIHFDVDGDRVLVVPHKTPSFLFRACRADILCFRNILARCYTSMIKPIIRGVPS